MPWVRLLGLAWPLLPAAWRARVNPATAATVLSVGLPLIERVLAGQSHRPLPTAASVDLARYAGTWHEIARLPNPFEAHVRRPAERALHAAHRWHRGGQPLPRAATAASVSAAAWRAWCPTAATQSSRSSFAPSWLHWLPFVWADYWVLHVDEAYDIAVVGHPSRRNLWVLSRNQRMPSEQLAALMEFAAALEFPVERLQIVQPNG